MLGRFLSASHAEQALCFFQALARHDTREWALTGGLAIEIHLLLGGSEPSVRPLNDIDFVANSFDCIPPTLANEFLLRHVHPLDPPGKIILQFVHPDSAMRVDIFRACGGTMSRTSNLQISGRTIRLISLEDLLARAARLALDLAEEVPTPVRHAQDFLRMSNLVNPAGMETAWKDHRKPKHPATFVEAEYMLRDLILTRRSLLITPGYSEDAAEVCPRCAPSAAFPLANP